MYADIRSNKRRTWILFLVFFAVIGIIGYVLTQYYGGYDILVIAAVFAVGMALVSYYSGDSVALAVAGAKPISKKDNPYIYRMVENLAITAGLPMPKVYLINDPALNAFATGRDPQHASVALTTGIVSALENEELEGVIAHELSHVKNYDIRVMMIVIVLVGFITLIADWFLRANVLGGRRRGDTSGGGVLMIIGLVLIILSPIFARLIQFAVSRKREYLADASGALLTRYPEGLARALEKIAAQGGTVSRRNHATAHLYIANPFKSRRSAASLFSTHPPIDERIKRLRAMA